MGVKSITRVRCVERKCFAVILATLMDSYGLNKALDV
jgi:hypothetical protein